MTFSDLGINLKGRTRGQHKVLCPKCSHTRGKHKSDPCLSVNIDNGMYRCHHCNWKGSINYSPQEEKKSYSIPVYNDTPLSDELLKYLESRGFSKSVIQKHKVTEEKGSMVFNYFRDGQLINRKFRTPDKKFRMEFNAELIFYNLDATKGQDYVIITEGEPDCMSFDEAGFQSVVSVPNGASSNKMQYLESAFDYFAQFNKIYIASDADEPGKQLEMELCRRLGKDRCCIVKYPPGCKDANEVLMKFGRSKLKECIASSEPYPIEGVITGNEVLDDTIRLYRKGVERGVELEYLGEEWCQSCTFKTSMLYTITGIPSHGKSSFVNYLEALLSAKCGWKWGIFSPEHYPLEYLIYRYAELLVGMPFFDNPRSNRMNEMTLKNAIKFVHEHFYFIRPEGEEFTLDRILEIGRSLVFRYGIKGFTIDPWNTIAHEFTGMSETQYTGICLNKLTAFKQVNDVCVFLVAHPTKIKKRQDGQFEVPNMYDISGSSNFFNKTDVGISVYRNFSTKVTEVYLQKMKYRNLGKVDRIDFQYNEINNRFGPTGYTEFNDSLLPKPQQEEMMFENLNGDNEEPPF